MGGGRLGMKASNQVLLVLFVFIWYVRSALTTVCVSVVLPFAARFEFESPTKSNQTKPSTPAMLYTRRTHAQARRRAALVGALTLLLPLVLLLVSGALAFRAVFSDLLVYKLH